MRSRMPGSARRASRLGKGSTRHAQRQRDPRLDLKDGVLKVTDGGLSGAFYCVLRTTRSVPLAMYYFNSKAESGGDAVSSIILEPGAKAEWHSDASFLVEVRDAFGVRTVLFVASSKTSAAAWVEQIQRFLGVGDGEPAAAGALTPGRFTGSSSVGSGSTATSPRGSTVDMDEAGEIESSLAHSSSTSKSIDRPWDKAPPSASSRGLARSGSARASKSGTRRSSKTGRRQSGGRRAVWATPESSPRDTHGSLSTDKAEALALDVASHGGEEVFHELGASREGRSPTKPGSRPLRRARAGDGGSEGAAALEAPAPKPKVFESVEDEFAEYFFRSTPQELRRALAGGALTDSPIRVLAWFLFMGVLPSGVPPSTWPAAISELREQYCSLRLRYWDRRGPDALVTKDGGMADPEKVAAEDSLLRAEIEKDVRRTFQKNQFFKSSGIMELLTRVLFVWDRAHPNVGYKQGMNELLAVVLWALRKVHITLGKRLKSTSDSSPRSSPVSSPRVRPGRAASLDMTPGPGPLPIASPADSGGRGRTRENLVADVDDGVEAIWDEADPALLTNVYQLCHVKFLEHDAYALLDQIMRRLIVMYAPGGVVAGTQFVYEPVQAPSSDGEDSDTSNDASSHSSGESDSDTEGRVAPEPSRAKQPTPRSHSNIARAAMLRAGARGAPAPTDPAEQGFGTLKRGGFGHVETPGDAVVDRTTADIASSKRWMSSPSLSSLTTPSGAALQGGDDEDDAVSSPPAQARGLTSPTASKYSSKGRTAVRARADTGSSVKLEDWTSRLASSEEADHSAKENPLLEALDRVQINLLNVADPDLSAHMQAIDVVPAMFLLRWRRLALARELPLEEVLILWDAVIGWSSDDWAFLDYICVAMLLKARDKLKAATDAPSALTVLTNFRGELPGVGATELVYDALGLRAYGSLQARDLEKVGRQAERLTLGVASGHQTARARTRGGRPTRRRLAHQLASTDGKDVRSTRAGLHTPQHAGRNLWGASGSDKARTGPG